MKCSYCGGSIIYHLGNCLEKGVLKCMACGREAKEMKNDEIKRDSDGNVIVPLGMIYQAGVTTKTGKFVKEHYRKYGYKTKARREDKKEKCAKSPGLKKQERTVLPNFSHETRPGSQRKKLGGIPITRATPEQIIAGLRSGVAIEIIDMIQKKFGL